MITKLDSLPDGGHYDLYSEGRAVEGYDTLISVRGSDRNKVIFLSDDESEIYLVDLGPLPMNKMSSWPTSDQVVARAAEEFRARA